jgi:hypothetical protein
VLSKTDTLWMNRLGFNRPSSAGPISAAEKYKKIQAIRVGLEEIVGDRKRAEERLDTLKQLETEVREFLAAVAGTEPVDDPLRSMAVDGLGSNANGFLHLDTEAQRSPIARFLFCALATGSTLSLAELKLMAQAQGIRFGNKVPGRVLHFALVGMRQNGLVSQVGKGCWKWNCDADSARGTRGH